MSRTLISIYIVTYNREDLLCRCVRSILQQNYYNLEILIYNNGDTFSFKTRKWLDEIDNVTVIESRENVYYAAGVNCLHAVSSGKLIALVGDDDYWCDPDKLELQTKQIEEGKNDICGTFWTTCNKDGQLEKFEPPINFVKNRKNNTIFLTKGSNICGSTPLIRRSIWDKLHGVDEKIGKGIDSDFFRRAYFQGANLVNVPVHTTIVDVAENRLRMTPVNSWYSKINSVRAHLHTIWKFRWLFILHPKALFFRVAKIIKLLVR